MSDQAEPLRQLVKIANNRQRARAIEEDIKMRVADEESRQWLDDYKKELAEEAILLDREFNRRII